MNTWRHQLRRCSEMATCENWWLIRWCLISWNETEKIEQIEPDMTLLYQREIVKWCGFSSFRVTRPIPSQIHNHAQISFEMDSFHDPSCLTACHLPMCSLSLCSLPQGRILNENDAHEPARAALCGPGHQKLVDQIHGQAAVAAASRIFWLASQIL